MSIKSVTPEMYDDVKHLIKMNKFSQREIARLVGLSNVTVGKIAKSETFEGYKDCIRKEFVKKAESVNPQTKFMASYAQMEKLNSQMKGLQESMDKVNNTLNAIYDILKRYMEV